MKSAMRMKWAVIGVLPALALGGCETIQGLFLSRTYPSGSYNACRTCSSTHTTAFDTDAAPEYDVHATFTVDSNDAILPSDVDIRLLLSCGVLPGVTEFVVTMQSDGLTRLKGTFTGSARSACIPSSGQRAPAHWSVMVTRLTNETPQPSITFRWDYDYVEYGE